LSEVCLSCGKELSFWSSLLSFKRGLCPSCKQIKGDQINQYINKLKEFGIDNYLESSEITELNDLQMKLELSKEDLEDAYDMINNLLINTKMADIQRYEQKLVELGEDGELSKEDEAALDAIKQDFDLSEDDIKHTYGYLCHLKKLTAINNGNLPVLNTDLLMKKGEVCHYEINTKLIEEKTKTSFVGGSQGFSIRIAKGVTYRTGGYKGERVEDVYREITDTGTLYITNKRILFIGANKNVSYTLKSISNYVKYSDGIQFQKENDTSPKLFIIDNTDCNDEIGLIVFKLISNIE